MKEKVGWNVEDRLSEGSLVLGLCHPEHRPEDDREADAFGGAREA